MYIGEKKIKERIIVIIIYMFKCYRDFIQYLVIVIYCNICHCHPLCFKQTDFITNRRMGGELWMRSEVILTSNKHNAILNWICHLGWSLCFLCRQEKCQNDGTKHIFGMLNLNTQIYSHTMHHLNTHSILCFCENN